MAGVPADVFVGIPVISMGVLIPFHDWSSAESSHGQTTESSVGDDRCLLVSTIIHHPSAAR